MLNLKEIFKLSQVSELQFEELMFLYAVHDVTTSPEDQEMKGLFNLYMTRFKFYNRGGEASPAITWVSVIEKLIAQGFIQDLRTETEKESSAVRISKLKVTEKFTDLIFVKHGKEYWWKYYLEMWTENAAHTPDNIPVVSGTNIYILKPNAQNPKMDTIEKIKNVFWEIYCLKGNKEAINTFFGNSQKYLETNGANMKVCNFFEVYKEMVKTQKV